jgi:hypothetical protein
MKVQSPFYLLRAFKPLALFFNVLITALLLSCKTVSYTIPQPVSMDLDKIKILSANLLNSYETKSPALPEENTLVLESNSKNKMSFEVLIAYRREGMNIVEDIRSGRVIDHKIIVKNSKGEILGRQAIDIENVKAIEFIGQSIDLDTRKAALQVGDYLNLSLELVYAMPFMDIGCEDSNIYCLKVRSLISNANDGGSKDSAETVRSSIKNKISDINKDLSPSLLKSPGTTVTLTPPLNLGDVNVISYREWKMISSPTHFKILSILKNGKQLDEGKEEVFELPDLPTAVEAEKELNKTFEIEKEKTPLKTAPSKRRKKTIYLP